MEKNKENSLRLAKPFELPSYFFFTAGDFKSPLFCKEEHSATERLSAYRHYFEGGALIESFEDRKTAEEIYHACEALGVLS